MEEDLEHISAEVFGSSPIVARFHPKKDLGCSWRMKGDTMHLFVSDYLKDAPADVIREYLTFIKERRGGEGYALPESILNWMGSERFIDANRGKYVQRCKNLSRTSEGKERNLTDSLDRLIDMDLICPDDIENSYFSWMRHSNHRKLGSCNMIMRVVSISSIFDDSRVPLDLLDYVVYHEVIHLRIGLRPRGRHHDGLFKSFERMYPNYSDIETRLRHLSNP